jgi:hypothetical protein
LQPWLRHSRLSGSRPTPPTYYILVHPPHEQRGGFKSNEISVHQIISLSRHPTWDSPKIKM